MDPQRIRCRHYYLTGRVQGVGFRYYLYRKALELGVMGWVRNLADGRVECCGEADSQALEKFEHHLRAGPRFGRVDAVDAEDRDRLDHSSFSIEV